MTSTKTYKIIDSVYGIVYLFILAGLISFSLTFALEAFFPIRI